MHQMYHFKSHIGHFWPFFLLLIKSPQGWQWAPPSGTPVLPTADKESRPSLLQVSSFPRLETALPAFVTSLSQQSPTWSTHLCSDVSSIHLAYLCQILQLYTHDLPNSLSWATFRLRFRLYFSHILHSYITFWPEHTSHNYLGKLWASAHIPLCLCHCHYLKWSFLPISVY